VLKQGNANATKDVGM